MNKAKIMEFSCLSDEDIVINKAENLVLHGIAVDVIWGEENLLSHNDISKYLQFNITASEITVTAINCDNMENIIIAPCYALVSIGDSIDYHKLQTDISKYLGYFEGKQLEYNPNILIEGVKYAHLQKPHL